MPEPFGSFSAFSSHNQITASFAQGLRKVRSRKSKQSRAPAATVSSELKRWTRRNIWLNPVLVLPGWPIEPPRAETSVVVLNEETETEFFVSHSRVPSHDQILEICSHLDRSARR
ncbi:MAG: hypothetical protein DMF14_16975 [Verrucomicrobia bacterium]|nr:MAG: hypothetical protein DMF14_16975 [Verrucomicrobiota bacterium]